MATQQRHYISIIKDNKLMDRTCDFQVLSHAENLSHGE